MKCAVLGRPIGHSLSPALHRAAYRELGLDWTYERYDVGAEELAGFVESRDDSWRGLSLTMPLKEAALALGDPDPVAAQVQAANTMIFEADGRRVYNTDVEGLAWALRRAGLNTASSVIILGTGATARSAVASVRALGAHTVTVVGRRPDRARPVTDLARHLGLEAGSLAWGSPLPAADLLISTVTTGAVTADPTPAGADALAAAAPVIFDAVYDPWPTPLAQAAVDAGRTVVNGLDLLIGQALVQIRLMSGAEVDAEVLYRAGRAALSDPSHGAKPSVSA